MERQFSSMSQDTQCSEALKSKRALPYEDAEIYDLLDVWSSHKVQQKFKTCKRHALVYEFIAQEHNKYGYSRNAKELKNKITNLKSTYRTFIPKSGGEPPSWPFYNTIHRVLGQTDYCNPDLLDDSLSSSLGQDSECDGVDIEKNLDRSSEGSYENSHMETAACSDMSNEVINGCTHATLPKRIPMALRKIPRPPRKIQSDEKVLVEAVLESNRKLEERSRILDEKENRAEQREIEIHSHLVNFMQLGALYLQRRLESESRTESTTLSSARPRVPAHTNTVDGNRSTDTSSSNLAKMNTPNLATPIRTYRNHKTSNISVNQIDDVGTEDHFDIQNMDIVMVSPSNVNILSDVTSRENVFNGNQRPGQQGFAKETWPNVNKNNVTKKTHLSSIRQKFVPRVKSDIFMKRNSLEIDQNNHELFIGRKRFRNEYQDYEDLPVNTQQPPVLRRSTQDHENKKSAYEEQSESPRSIESNQNSAPEQISDSQKSIPKNDQQLKHDLINEIPVVDGSIEHADGTAEVPFDALLDESFSDLED